MQSVSLDKIINNFNPRQKQAATMPLESCLVLAGAGSGKTSVLTARIGWVTERMNILPERVLAVTFTNKAAEEMRKRLRRIIGDEAVAKMWIGTFHSLCNRILRQEYQAADLPREFAILDVDGQERIIREILKDIRAEDPVDEDEEKTKPAVYAKGINEAKEAMLGPNDVDPDLEGLPAHFHDVFAGYNKVCQRQGLLDFCDLQTKTVELLRANPAIEKMFQQKFQAIFVDEFQDTNAVQYEWLQRLGRHAAVMAVGDDDQSIYGFRGAEPENMQRFLREFARGTKVALEQNYRSLPFVLKAANAVIKNNTSRLGKTLFTQQPDRHERILHAVCDNGFTEARFIAQQVKQLIERGVKPAEIAVLYRTNTQSRLIEPEMLKAAIPVTVYGGYRFYDRQEVKHLFAYLDLACNIGRDIAFSRIVNVPPRGLGERTIEALRLQAKESGVSMLEQIAINADALATTAPGKTGKLADKKQQALEGFFDLIVQLGEASQEMSLEEFMDTTLRESGLETYYESLAVEEEQKGKTSGGKDDAKERLENLYAARDNAAQFELDFISAREKAGDPTPAGGWRAVHILPDYLAEIALLTSTSEADMNKKNTVSLMTVHASKGLEFSQVFIAGMEEGLFPHKRSIGDGQEGGEDVSSTLYRDQQRAMEEERRLMYVAITRAKHCLTMCRAVRRKTSMGWDTCAPSRFFKEIPVELLRGVSINDQKLTARQSSPPAVGRKDSEERPSRFMRPAA